MQLGGEAGSPHKMRQRRFFADLIPGAVPLPTFLATDVVELGNPARLLDEASISIAGTGRHPEGPTVGRLRDCRRPCVRN
jgi:hypothetical protein